MEVWILKKKRWWFGTGHLSWHPFELDNIDIFVRAFQMQELSYVYAHACSSSLICSSSHACMHGSVEIIDVGTHDRASARDSEEGRLVAKNVGVGAKQKEIPPNMRH